MHDDIYSIKRANEAVAVANVANQELDAGIVANCFAISHCFISSREYTTMRLGSCLASVLGTKR